MNKYYTKKYKHTQKGPHQIDTILFLAPSMVVGYVDLANSKLLYAQCAQSHSRKQSSNRVVTGSRSGHLFSGSSGFGFGSGGSFGSSSFSGSLFSSDQLSHSGVGQLYTVESEEALSVASDQPRHTLRSPLPSASSLYWKSIPM